MKCVFLLPLGVKLNIYNLIQKVITAKIYIFMKKTFLLLTSSLFEG